MAFRKRVEDWLNAEEKRLMSKLYDSRNPNDINTLRGSLETIRKMQDELFQRRSYGDD